MDVEEDRFFGLCKCCLQDGCFRSLWVEYDEDGVAQNYGEMLNECFSLHWQKPDNVHLEQICDECVKRTSESFSFRQLVLQSQEQLTSHFEVPVEPGEPVEFTEVLDAESGEIAIIVKNEAIESLEPDFDEYEEVEYLEVDLEKQELVDDPSYHPEPEQTRRRSKKRGRRQRTYKNYSNEDLVQSFEAAKSGRMTVAEAAAAYNVPRKTIAARLLNDRRGLPIGPKIIKNDVMVNEIRTLLTYTNLTPYKTRTAHYHCAYCGTDGPLFEDPDALRTHTRTQHIGERTKAVDEILKPLWLNEVLKVDIENLHCTVCCTILVSWNDMFKHLNERHNLEFDEAYTRVIPYVLQSELRCALCKENFPNYHHLDSHMNAHYNNYMCSECGDTFLSASRLKKHLKIHETGRYVCDECGKVFTLEKYRKKHVELVHKQNENIKCLYCSEKFLGTYPRHLHVLECHRDKIKTITCELCGKTFDWRPYFLAHVRRKHNNEKNYKCSLCDAQFFMKSELKRHEDAHKKTTTIPRAYNPKYSHRDQKPGKYQCKFCGKNYSSKNCFITHIGTHEALLDDTDLEQHLASFETTGGSHV